LGCSLIDKPGELARSQPSCVATSDDYERLLGDVLDVLALARTAAARSVNKVMTATYWQIGRRIVEGTQSGAERATYAEEVVDRLAVDLTQRFGRGFSARNLRQFRQFYLTWPASEIWQTPSAKSSGPDSPLPWSAYVRLLSVKNEPARAFYEAGALRGEWTVRQLNRQIDSMLYERAALSTDKTAMLAQGEVPVEGGPVAQLI
jgi:hypothetical protein